LNQNDTIGSIWPPSTMSKPLMGGGRTALVQKKEKNASVLVVSLHSVHSLCDH